MRLPVLLACAAFIAALPPATAETVSDTVPATCVAVANADGQTGAGCGVQATCHQAEWGYHSEFLTVGGANGCSAGAWADPGASPEEPLDFLGPVSGADIPASCIAAADQDGRTGAGCGAHLTCATVLWGYHSEFLTVGGSGCSGGVWVNPDAEPEGLPFVDAICLSTADLC